MGSYRLLPTLLVFSTLALSQPQASTQAKTYTVAGQVMNQLTGAPIPRTLVQIAGRSQLTGGEGEFLFPAVPEGRTQISVSKPGYFAAGSRTRFSQPIPLSVGSESDKLVFKMVPEAVVIGQVTGNDHEALEGAQILVMQYTNGRGPNRLTPLGVNARSDEDGNFRIAGLSSGRYFIAVKAGNVSRTILGAASLQKNQTYPGIIYYPGTPDFAAALPIDLSPGQKFDVHFELAMIPAYRVAGTLVSGAGMKQLFAPSIVDAIGQQLFSPTRFDLVSGHFEFMSLPAGNYRFILRGTGQDDKPVLSVRNITISRATDDLKLPLRPGAEIPVVIRTDFSKPQTPRSCTSNNSDGTTVTSDCSDFPRAHVELLSPDSIQSTYNSDYGPLKDSRALAIRNVPAGKYVVRATTTFGGYVQSIRSGTHDLLREELAVPEDGQVSPIEVTVRDDGGSLRISLRTDNPSQNATCVLLPTFGVAPEPQMIGVAVAWGQTQTAPLAPGNYKLFAFDPAMGIAFENLDRVEKYAAQATTVTVSANSDTNVVLDVIKGDVQ
jgi:hypothetical protein